VAALSALKSWVSLKACRISTELLKEVVVSERMIGRLSLEDIFSGVKTQKQRNDRIVAARNRAAYSITEISKFLRLNRSTVSRIYHGKIQQCHK